MKLSNFLKSITAREKVMAGGQVVPDSSRCVQCGICSYYCPVGIDVRRHAWTEQPVVHSECLTCGECIRRCPRDVLSFQRTGLIKDRKK
jgi:ferredoxin